MPAQSIVRKITQSNAGTQTSSSSAATDNKSNSIFLVSRSNTSRERECKKCPLCMRAVRVNSTSMNGCPHAQALIQKTGLKAPFIGVHNNRLLDKCPVSKLTEFKSLVEKILVEFTEFVPLTDFTIDKTPYRRILTKFFYQKIDDLAMVKGIFPKENVFYHDEDVEMMENNVVVNTKSTCTDNITVNHTNDSTSSQMHSCGRTKLSCCVTPNFTSKIESDKSCRPMITTPKISLPRVNSDNSLVKKSSTFNPITNSQPTITNISPIPHDGSTTYKYTTPARRSTPLSTKKVPSSSSPSITQMTAPKIQKISLMNKHTKSNLLMLTKNSDCTALKIQSLTDAHLKDVTKTEKVQSNRGKRTKNPNSITTPNTV